MTTLTDSEGAYQQLHKHTTIASKITKSKLSLSRPALAFTPKLLPWHDHIGKVVDAPTVLSQRPCRDLKASGELSRRGQEVTCGQMPPKIHISASRGINPPTLSAGAQSRNLHLASHQVLATLWLLPEECRTTALAQTRVQCDMLDLTHACLGGLQDIGHGGCVCCSDWKVPCALALWQLDWGGPPLCV